MGAFVSTPRLTHKAVSWQSLVRWLKDVLILSGVDTKKFSGHSTRHAASSSAWGKGMPIDLFFRAASNSSVCARLFNIPFSVDPGFSDVVF